MNKNFKIYKVFRIILIFWCLFIGIGALAGSFLFFTHPKGDLMGMSEILPYFRILPFADVLFQDFIFPGIALLIVNGLTNLTASVFLILKKKIGIILGTIFGFTLMLWIIIQFIILPTNFMSILYFIFGCLQLVSGYICFVFFKRSLFTFKSEEYTNINKNTKNLVVYFSRNGYSKKIAYEIAAANGSYVLELKTKERTDGFLGFLWCGRFNMHRWGMSISDYDIDVSRFEKVIIVSPIWVFSICAPIREFLRLNKAKIKSVDYVFVHFMKARFSSLARQVDELIGIKHEKLLSITCRMGDYSKKDIRNFKKENNI